MNNEFSVLLNQLNYPVLLVDAKHKPQFANKKFLTLHKFSLKALRELQNSPIDKDAIDKKEYVLTQKSKNFYFKVELSDVSTKDKTLYLISLFDISKSKKLFDDIVLKKKIFVQLSEYLPEGIVLFEQSIIYSNKMFEKLIGYSSKELQSKKFEELVDASDLENFNENLYKMESQHKAYRELELKLITKNKKEIWVRLKASFIINNNKKLCLSIVTDIYHERLEISNLTRLAYYDTLTGIYNRRKFDDLMLSEFKRSKRYKRDLCGLFLDIDHFKKVNDTYGHDVGDIVLQELAKSIQTHVRETDIFARWGGEEFIILLPETNKEEAFILAENIRNEVGNFNFTKAGHITISIGITQLKDQEQQKSFIKRLDKAMYKAKQEGRNRSVAL
jgi:diguanylate cyclase (GGDEF)-like protein/PAS domain S-box-containing protein